MLDEEKPLMDPSHPADLEIPSSPAESSSMPHIIPIPSFTIHLNEDLGEVQLQEQGPTKAQASIPGPSSPFPSVYNPMVEYRQMSGPVFWTTISALGQRAL